MRPAPPDALPPLLLKWCHWVEDTEGRDMELGYFRDNEKREVDFVVVRNRKPILLIECKYGDRNLSPSLRYLARKHSEAKAVQLCFDADVDVPNAEGIRICNAAYFLRELV